MAVGEVPGKKPGPRARALPELTEGPILPALITLSWPMMVGNLLQTAYNLADTLWLGRVGAAAVAAISMSFPIVFFLISWAGGFTVAGTALVAQHTGAGDKDGANLVASQTLTFVGILAVVLGTAGYLLAEWAMTVMGAGPAVLPDATAYLRIIFMGVPFMFGFFLFSSLLRGYGDTITPMKLMIASTVLNIVLDPLLIFGWFGFPEMGVPGAALATIVSRGLATIVALWLLFGGKTGLEISLDRMRPRWAVIKKIIVVGFPSAIEQSTRAFGFATMTGIVALFGTNTVAAYGIGNRINSLLFMPASAIGMGATTMMGQNLGAGKPSRAEKSTWLASGFTAGLLTLAGAVIFVFAKPIVILFNDNPEVIMYGTRYLRTIAFSLGLAGAMFSLNGSFRGAGRTTTAMVLSLLSLWGLRVPLARYLSVNLGMAQDGLWWAVFAANSRLVPDGFLEEGTSDR